MSKLIYLKEHGLIAPPPFMNISTIQYETIMGSLAYGVSSDNSDLDIYGFCIPPKEMIFPHLSGYIPGFGSQPTPFAQLQKHHIKLGDTEYDITIYNIVKYFNLCMENNPNMIDSLYTPNRCLTAMGEAGKLVRQKRQLFLSKQVYHKFKGYAYAQYHKIKTKTPDPDSKRYANYKKFGYDIKYAYHLVRLLNEAEQLLIEHTVDLEKNREQLKSIRRGEWSLEQIFDHFQKKEIQLDALYHTSTLPPSPQEDEIKELLLNCLEIQYGSLNGVISKTESDYLNALNQIYEIVDQFKR